MTTSQKAGLLLMLDEVDMIAYTTDAEEVCRFHYNDSVASNAYVERTKEIVRRVNSHEQLFTALQAAEQAIDEAAEIMLYEEGQPVTALESWEIERAYFALISVMVQVHDALDSARDAKERSPV
jgi:hypothetical protein